MITAPAAPPSGLFEAVARRSRGYSLYVTRDYLDAFLEHPQLSQWAAERRLCLILWDSARIPRIVIGDGWVRRKARGWATDRDMSERIYAYQSTVRGQGRSLNRGRPWQSCIG